MTSGMSAGIPGDAFASYLARLGITGPLGAPSAEGLFALQRAHLERVPYENVDIQLGRSVGIDPGLSVRRFAAGRGGYCFHLNGAFAALLDHLGYAVTRHLGGVLAEPDAESADGSDAGAGPVSGNHLALTVRVDGAEYFVDAGLGDGPYEPLPLREGAYRQGGFDYALDRLDARGWTYRNPGSSAPVVNFLSAPAKTADFEAEHVRLSTSEESGFVRAFAALRRDAEGIDVLRGRVLSRIGPKDTAERVLEGPEEFYAVLEGVFGRELDDLTPVDRAALWTRVDAAHEAWLETRRT